jgi:FixJ family two-component response regulator
MAQVSVCVVDDDEEVRESIASFFRSAGVSVLVFDSAEGLLGSDVASAVDCVVTDLHMPGMNGLELRQELLRRKHTMPLIVMTAFPTEEARMRAAELEVHAFMCKPVDPDELLRLIDSSLLLRSERR